MRASALLPILLLAVALLSSACATASDPLTPSEHRASGLGGSATPYAAASDPFTPSEHYQRALEAESRGDWGEARDEFKAAGDYQDAKQQVEKAQANVDTIVQSYDRAIQDMNNEHYREAMPLLDTVLALSPTFKDAAERRQEAAAKAGP